MSYLPFAVIAQLLNSISVTVDKFLLSKSIPDPLIYIFYFSLISILVLLVTPFIPGPTMPVLILGSLSSFSWIVAAYLMFALLKMGQVQRVIPIIGALTPIFLLIFAGQSLSIIQIEAITVLILGLLILTLEDLKGRFEKRELLMEIGAALFFALSYYLLSLGFAMQSFLTVLVWSKPSLIPIAVVLLIIPTTRRKILGFIQKDRSNQSVSQSHRNLLTGVVFAFGQTSAVLSELLLTYAISLANPAIVNSLQGLKYVFLLIFSLILGRRYPEVFKNKSGTVFLITQFFGITLIVWGLYLLAVAK